LYTRWEVRRSWCWCGGDSESKVGRPGPPIHLRLVYAVLVCVGLAFELQGAQLFLRVSAGYAQGRHPIDHVHRNGEAINLVPNGQVEWSVDIAVLLVAADVQVLVIGAPVSEPVNQPRIPVKVEDDRFVLGE